MEGTTIRKGDAGRAIAVGFAVFGIVLIAPAWQRLVAWWPVPVGMILIGWVLGRVRPGPGPRLIVAAGIAWLTYVVLVIVWIGLSLTVFGAGWIGY